MTAETLLPIAVLLPLGVAALLATLAHWLPTRVGDVSSILTALATAAICATLAHASLDHPVPHWFAGWTPASAHRPGVVLGIGFLADPASAAVACFCAILFAANFVFAWGYFDEVHAHFHVLMLLFLAAMIGFCLTHDLFNLFVWFELMSVAAFALTAHPLGESALEGAFNFTITNSLASFLMLIGIALIYARAGTLDFSAIDSVAIHAGRDPVTLAGLCLIACALLTKGAILPFHFWLPDAHSVAPSPVSVIFSGAMVSLGLFGLAKLGGEAFAGWPPATALLHGPLLALGVATAVVPGLMAWGQRHLKRLLAFSTISHLGVMAIGIASRTAAGTAGLLLYFAGHGLVKAALFMIAGVLLSLRASADEFTLYRQGRDLRAAGCIMLLGGLMLGGLPLGPLHGGAHLVEANYPGGLVHAAMIASSVLTGAAVTRAGLRIFVGWSGAPGVERRAPTEPERETSKRPLLLMLVPAVLLLALAMLPVSGATGFLATAAPLITDAAAYAPVTWPAAEGALATWTPLVLTIALVAIALCRERPTRALSRLAARAEGTPFRLLERVHSGIVTDYVAWAMFGLACLALAI